MQTENQLVLHCSTIQVNKGHPATPLYFGDPSVQALFECIKMKGEKNRKKELKRWGWMSFTKKIKCGYEFDQVPPHYVPF